VNRQRAAAEADSSDEAAAADAIDMMSLEDVIVAATEENATKEKIIVFINEN
jgi:hypothetical protein